MKSILNIVVFASLFSSALYAQPFLNPFKYTQPLTDTINTRWFPKRNTHVIGKDDRIVSKNGHFVNQKGERIRLLGSLLSYSACYPDSAQAIRIARRFQDLGINAVRFRGWDVTATWGYLLPWQASTTDTVFNNDNIKKLDWFIYQLQQHGVYVFLNFNAFTPRQRDGVWKYDSINYSWNVLALQSFHPSYQNAQRKFIKNIMQHVNQFSKVAYKDDPTIALINITDENSLATYWSRNFQNGSTPLFCYSHRMLFDTLFNSWLKKKYSNDATLKLAWSNGTINSNNILRDPGFEDAFSSPWTLSVGSTTSAVLAYSDGDKVEGSQSARVRIQTSGSYPYELQLRQGQCNIIQGRQYKITFWAKTTTQQVKRPLSILLVRDNTPYDPFGINVTDTITSAWKQYSFTFVANTTYPTALLIFGLGGSMGDVYLDNVSFTEEAPTTLLPGESLVTNNVSALWGRNTVSNKRTESALEFIQEITSSYYQSIFQLFRDTLKSQIMLSGNGITNSLSDVVTNKNADYTCATGYWGYFLNSFEDGKPWQMYRYPMAESPYGAQLASLALGKQKGKPYIVNNMYQIYPSSNNLELTTMMPIYSSFQDWDGIFFGEWCSDINKMDSANITRLGWWEVKGLYNIHSQLPAITYALQQGFVQPGTTSLPFNYSSYLAKNPAWQTSAYFLPQSCDNRIPYFRRTEIDSLDAKVQTFLPQNEIPEFTDVNGLDMSNITTDTKQIQWNQVDGWVKANTGRFMSITGKLNKGIISFDSTISIEKTDNTVYGALSWVSLDTININQSAKSFLTFASSRIQNHGAIWEGDSSLWKSWGNEYTELEALTARFTVTSTFDTLIVYPLNAQGEITGTPIVAQKGTNNKFRFTLNQSQTKCLWYAVEQKLNATPVQEEATIVETVDIFPNPADNSITLEYPEANEHSAIRISSITGEVISTINPEINSSTVRIDCSRYTNGVYILQFIDEQQTITKKFVIQR